MQLLLSFHVPYYEKAFDAHEFQLAKVLRVERKVHPNAPIAHAWNTLLDSAAVHSALFQAGDKTTYSCVKDQQCKIYEVFNFRHQHAPATIKNRSNDISKVQNESSILFVEKGLLRSLPIPDMIMKFPPSIIASKMRATLEEIHNIQHQTFMRLRDNVQFLDAYQNEIVECMRIEQNKVNKKRKRNCEHYAGK